jgi:hypothetical protein
MKSPEPKPYRPPFNRLTLTMQLADDEAEYGVDICILPQDWDIPTQALLQRFLLPALSQLRDIAAAKET